MVLLFKLVVASFGFATSLAAATKHKQAPSVAVKNGTYTGVYSPHYDQDFFLGMPYAQVPERFSVAKSLDKSWKGKQEATAYSPICVGYGGDDIGHNTSENCLYLNVVRPAGVDRTQALPVAVWIHGGGLVMGGSADKRYNLSFIVEHGVEMGTPFIGVSLNYRLSAFGFLSGKEAVDAGSANIGFRDQRLALHWVRENIAAFGGSPHEITIWGESSGAESVAAQALAYNGRDDKLFRGIMAESGFGGLLDRFTGGFNATDDMQTTYNNLVKNTSCAHLVGTPESLQCLRDAPFEEIDHALGVLAVGPWAPVLDKDFFQDYPANQLSRGNFVQVPVLSGTNSDEGSSFGPEATISSPIVNNDAQMRAAITPWLQAEKTKKTVEQLTDELMYLYPNIQSRGIPSLKTWPHVIQPNDGFAQALGLQHRRTGAIFGDKAMHYRRRRASLAWAKHGVPSYAYRFNVVVNGVEESAGATHFQEVAFVFLNLNGDGYALNPFDGNGTYPIKAKALAKTMSTAWVNFITSLDPNGAERGHHGHLEWPSYDTAAGGGVGQDIVFDLDGSFVELDDWRAEGINWFIENSLAVLGS